MTKKSWIDPKKVEYDGRTVRLKEPLEKTVRKLQKRRKKLKV